MSGIELIDAASSKNAKRVKMLLAQNVNVDSSLEAVTALMYAANYGNLGVVNILLDAGANINRQDNNGATALIWAAKGDNPDVIQLLLKAGSNIDLQNVQGETALIKASVNNKLEAVRALILSGANINIRDTDGKRAYDSTKNEEIKSFIGKYHMLDALRLDGATYLFIIPRDLVGVIRDQL